MLNERANFPAFNLPIVCLPASISNNLPGSEFSIGADTALNSIVDVRFKIVDAKKAHALFDYHAALLVDQQALILAPHMHHHDKLISGGSFVIFFPTQRNTVHTGSSVSLVLGSLRLEPLIVQ